MSDKDWTLSYLSSVAGQVTATAGPTASTLTGESSRNRLYAWSEDDASDYWLRFIEGSDGSDKVKQTVLIDAFIAPSKKMYAVIGYCVYHNIRFEIDESGLEEVCDECREKAH